MKQLIHIISILLAFSATLPAYAVTDKEMEQARTIAAQTYLRYANDGSGYLDSSKPKTMAELERVLKPKEKENLKAFKSIPVPKDYASWDKKRLVEYWGNTAFASKGLLDKGKIGKSKARRKLEAMTVTPPQKAAKKPENGNQSKPSVTASHNTAAATSEKPATTSAAPTPEADAEVAATDSIINTLSAATDALSADPEEEIEKAENHTWIYIIILCILVGVVVALVVFASNVMKKNGGAGSAKPVRPSPATMPDNADANTMREKFAATLNAKNNEIHTLNKKIEELASQNATLKTNLESLTAETASLRTRLTEATRKLSSLADKGSSPGQETRDMPSPQPQASPAPQPHQGAASQPRQATPLRTIFLGRANAKGIFVRADRSLNIGNSIYRLDTTDGYAGTFRVANDPTVWEMALLTPRESLSGACSCAELENTEGKERIVTDSSGTAIFEGGCWKVIRKAKIHYE